jgi:hypothetical protein
LVPRLSHTRPHIRLLPPGPTLGSNPCLTPVSLIVISQAPLHQVSHQVQLLVSTPGSHTVSWPLGSNTSFLHSGSKSLWSHAWSWLLRTHPPGSTLGSHTRSKPLVLRLVSLTLRLPHQAQHQAPTFSGSTPVSAGSPTPGSTQGSHSGLTQVQPLSHACLSPGSPHQVPTLWCKLPGPTPVSPAPHTQASNTVPGNTRSSTPVPRPSWATQVQLCVSGHQVSHTV